MTLREHVESEMNGWGDVYLDNALPQGAKGRPARGALGSLEQKGLYRPYGDGAFGQVRLPSRSKQL